jgi:hypothetical protein
VSLLSSSASPPRHTFCRFGLLEQFSCGCAAGILDAAGKTVAATRKVFSEADVQ